MGNETPPPNNNESFVVDEINRMITVLTQTTSLPTSPYISYLKELKKFILTLTHSTPLSRADMAQIVATAHNKALAEMSSRNESIDKSDLAYLVATIENSLLPLQDCIK